MAAWLAPSWAAVSTDFRVDRTNQVSSVRYGRDHFDFTYTVDVTSNGPARSAVRATVTSRSASTQILDGSVVLGDVGAGASLRSTDTFSFRQNRTVPFNPADLVWVFEYNAPPTLAPVAAQQVTVGQTLSLLLQGADSETTVSYAYSPALANANLDAATGAFTFTPNASQVGAHDVTFTVSDGALTAAVSTTIAVVRGNVPPVIDSSPVTTAAVGVTYSYDVNASDADGDSLAYALSAAPAGMSIAATTGVIQWTPAASQVGPQDVTVRVSDGHGGLVDQSFVVTVSAPANRPPVISSTPVLEGAVEVAYSYGVEASDPDGDTLTYSLTAAPGGMTIQSGSGLISWLPSVAQSGVHAVTVRVVDGRNGEDTQSFQVTVAAAPPENLPPTILAIADKTVHVGQTLTFTVLASDPEGEALDYSLAQAPPNATLNDDGQFSFTPTDAQVGEHEITAAVSDGDRNASTYFRIMVRGQNRTPTITSTPTTSAVDGQSYQYAVVASDPDGDALSFTLTSSPQGMTIQGTSGAISWTPGAHQTGDRAVTVRATDPSGAFDEQEYTVEVLASADRVAPVVKLTAPSASMVDTEVVILAAAFDDLAVTRVAWYVGTTLVEQDAQPPYRLAYATPETAGQSLVVRAVAFDAAGNQGEDTASILAVATPDTTPPVIDGIKLPPTAAPSEQTTVGAKVHDDRGIANVGFSRAGTPLGIVELEPYEVRFTVPADAPIGSQVTITVVARDTSSNETTGQATLTVVGAPDIVAPTAVTVNSPPTARAGQTIPIIATAVDAGGVFKVQFFVDGVLFAEDSEAPYEVEYAIADTAPAGKQFKFVARAIDFSGNGTTSAPDKTEVVAGAEGVITGEVYDDSVGLALGAVTVEVLRAGGRDTAPIRTVTADAEGRYQIALPEGEALLRLAKAGFTTAYRQLEVVRDSVNSPLDARLTPRATARLINPLAGTTIAATGASLTVPAGAYASAASLHLTRLTGQSLPAPLPLGWAPIEAYEVSSLDGGPRTTMTLTLARALAANEIVAEWDATARLWIRTEATVAANATIVNLARLRNIAVARADVMPEAPVTPATGTALQSVEAVALPQNASARINPSPEVLFMRPGAKSDVSATIEGAGLLPSGTVLSVDFSESYEHTDNTLRIPDRRTQDLHLYQSQTENAAAFPASPSEIFEPTLLRRGVIRLVARDPADAAGSSVIGTAGGSITTAVGSVAFSAGAFSSPTPVRLTSFSGTPPTALPESFTLLAGLMLEAGAPFGTTAQLSLSVQNVPAGASLLWLHTVQVGNETVLQLVAAGALANGRVTTDTGFRGLPFRGVYESGQYLLVAASEPLGYVTGQVSPPTDGTIVSVTASFPASLASAATNNFVVVAPLGNQTIRARTVGGGAAASIVVSVPAANSVLVRNLNLVASQFAVQSTDPANGATNVSKARALTVTLSQRMDPSTASVSSVTLIGPGNATVTGTVIVSADRQQVTFRPDSPLEEGTQYRLNLSANIRSESGVLLGANVVATQFTTEDRTPPPRPDLADVSVEYVTTGSVRVSGGPGAAQPGAAVNVRNAQTGETITVLAGPDGSFSVLIALSPGAQLSVAFADGAGAQAPVTVHVPPVPVSIEAIPNAILGTEAGQIVPVVIRATLSDGSVRDLSLSNLQVTFSTLGVASVNGDGRVVLQSTGATVMTVAHQSGPFNVSTAIPVALLGAVGPASSGTVGSTGLEFRTDDGLTVDVPAGSAPAGTILTVSRVVLPQAGGRLALPGVAGSRVIAAYRFTPDIVFSSPVTIGIPAVAALQSLQPGERLAVFVAERADLSDLKYDGLLGDVEGAAQAVDALNGVVSVSTTHFSFRFLAAIDTRGGLGAAVSKTTPGAPPISVYRVTRTAEQMNALPPNQLQHVVWHSPLQVVRVGLDLQLRRGEAPRNVRISVRGRARDLELRELPTETPEGMAINREEVSFQYDIPSITRLVPAIAGEQRTYAARLPVVFTSVATRVWVRVTDITTNGETCEEREFELHLGNYTLGDAGGDYGIPLIGENGFTATAGRTFIAEEDECASYLRAAVQGPPPSSSDVQVAKDKQDYAHALVLGDGSIVWAEDPARQMAHAGNFSGGVGGLQSLGIEIQNTGHPFDFYPGTQLDSLLALTEYYLSLPGTNFKKTRNRTDVPVPSATDLRDYDLTHALSLRTIAASDFLLKEPVVTHLQVCRDGNYCAKLADDIVNPGGISGGFNKMKTDPLGHLKLNDPGFLSKQIFPLETLVHALEYDFPGVVDTSGGDSFNVGRATCGTGRVCAGNGGFVDIRVGQPAEGELTPSAFPGLPLIPVVIGPNQLPPELRGVTDRVIEKSAIPVDCSSLLNSDDGETGIYGHLVIRGTLRLSNATPCRLRVSGSLYLAPTGIIDGRTSLDGASIEILAAGPVVLHGKIDLRGADQQSGPAGNGGNLIVRSTAKSPFHVPAIVTRGGDAGIIDPFLEGAVNPLLVAERATGGFGGDVFLVGPEKGMFVFSGVKENLPNPTGLSCDPQTGYEANPGAHYGGDVPAGHHLPINFFPNVAGRSWTNSFLRNDQCEKMTDYQPLHGIYRHAGRGIVTSGGNGASGALTSGSNADLAFPATGGQGGSGGNILIDFVNSAHNRAIANSAPSGYLRFRDTPLITGVGAGFTGTRIEVAFEWPIMEPILGVLVQTAGQPTQKIPVIQNTGSMGGTGATRNQCRITFGDASPICWAGENGGPGGRAGDIVIDPQAMLVPIPSGLDPKLTASTRAVYGHSGDEAPDAAGNRPKLVKDVPGEMLGAATTLSAKVGTSQVPLVTFNVALADSDVPNEWDLAKAKLQDGCTPVVGTVSSLCLAGGSGGIPGGSRWNGYGMSTRAQFDRLGTSGAFGLKGGFGTLVAPDAVLDAVRAKFSGSTMTKPATAPSPAVTPPVPPNPSLNPGS
jgi:hypothetical protein